MHRVFVYGTLKSGQSRSMTTMPGATYVGDAATAESEFEMIDLGSFPAVLLGGINRVAGEVWAVDDETLNILDSIEGFPHFYKRTLVDTTQGQAWIYYLENNEYDDPFIISNLGLVEWKCLQNQY